MTEHDLLEVVEIEETCGLSRWGWDAYHAELMKSFTTVMLVARRPCSARRSSAQPPGIVGFIAARLAADELHINNVAVRPAHRRQGVGAALLATALKEAAQRGATRAVLEVRAANADAQALYRRQGFRVAGRRTRYYTAPPEDALTMVTEL